MSQEAKDVIQEEEAVVEGETVTKDEDSAAMPPPAEKAIEIEKMEEQKLKSKFPGESLFSFTTRPASLNLVKYFFNSQPLEAVQEVAVSQPSSRRDWEKARSILTLVTIRWPNRGAAWDEVRLDHVRTQAW